MTEANDQQTRAEATSGFEMGNAIFVLLETAGMIVADGLHPQDVSAFCQTLLVGNLAAVAYCFLLAAVISLAEVHVVPELTEPYDWQFDGHDLVRLLKVTLLIPIFGPLYVAFFGWMLLRWVIWIVFISWRRKNS